MMWIAVHLAFAALPFVLTAALYSRKRRFPAGEGDARARDAKARKVYAQLLLVLLLLYHYAYTNGHPGGFGVLLSTGACAALFSSRRTDRWLRGLSGRPRAFAVLALTAVAIGFDPLGLHGQRPPLRIHNQSVRGEALLPLFVGEVDRRGDELLVGPGRFPAARDARHRFDDRF